jgi:hypothetical protein
MWFRSDTEKKKNEQLDKYLRRQIDEAAEEFDRMQPSFFSMIFGGKRKKSRLAFQPIALSGFNHALRTAVTTGAAPEAVVYSTAANVAIDMFSNYYQGVETAVKEKGNLQTKLSLNLISQENIPEKIKRNIAKMRFCIQKAILATAEYIEMREFASLKEVIDEGQDSDEQTKRKSLVNAQYCLHVSYRSLAISLQLFSAINQELLKRIAGEKSSRPDVAHRFLITNAVFVYEIADFITTFLRAFELQGIPELQRLHRENMIEIENARGQIEEIRQLIGERANSNTVLNLEKERSSLDEKSAAIATVETVWSQLQRKIEDAQSGSQTFRGYIADFDIIKRNAALNLSILTLMAVTKMVSENVEKMQQMMLQVEKLQLPSITADDVRRFFNLNSPLPTKPLINSQITRVQTH